MPLSIVDASSLKRPVTLPTVCFQAFAMAEMTSQPGMLFAPSVRALRYWLPPLATISGHTRWPEGIGLPSLQGATCLGSAAYATVSNSDGEPDEASEVL